MGNSSSSKRDLLPTVLISAIVFLAYGIPIVLGWFGFYVDDWIYIINNRMAGPQSFPAFVAWDRPHSAWIYMLTGYLFGDNPLPYHLLLLAERWLAVWLVWKILRILWLEAHRLVAAAVLFFAIYPGFQQQPIAVQYILHFASLDLCLFSIFAMLKAWQETDGDRVNRSWFIWKGLGLAASAVALFSCEYFFGLELIRPLILWIAICNHPQEKTAASPLKQQLKNWLLYLVPLFSFVYWRVFVFSFQTYQPKFLDKLGEQFVTALVDMGKRVIRDLITVSCSAWRQTARIPADQTQWIAWTGLIIISFLMVFGFLRTRKCLSNQDSDKSKAPVNSALQMFTLGIAALLTAGIPFWITQLDIELAFPWDRPTIAFSFGAALFLSALLNITLSHGFQSIAIAVLIALSIGFHYQNNLIYRDENQKMADYFWQLAWRAPGLEKGTILVSEAIPLNRYSDSDLTPVVNWQYSPDLKGYAYDYKYFDLDLRYQLYFEGQEAGTPISHAYRSHQFESSSDKVLALFYQEDGCLRVITNETRFYPDLPQNLITMAKQSNPALIQLNPQNGSAVPPASLGEEPARGYCYYYQQIERAHQLGDLETEHALTTQLLDQQLAPNDQLDWYPVIRVLAESGDFNRLEPVLSAAKNSERTSDFLCKKALEYIEEQNKAQFQAEFAEICKFETGER